MLVRLSNIPLILTALILAGGCDARDSTAAAPRPTPSKAAGHEAPSGVDWTARGCSLPDAPRAPLGRTATALLAAFGKPAVDTRFVLGRGLTPPRMTLLNRLPLKGNENRSVRELGWVRNGCALTIWLVERDGAWRAVQTLRASAEAEY